MAEWVTVAPVEAVKEGEMIAVTVGNRQIALYCVGGEYYATDNLCTHGLALLTDGFLDGMEIECPLHGGRFEIDSGKGLGEPISCDIRTYPTRMADTQLQVQLDAVTP